MPIPIDEFCDIVAENLELGLSTDRIAADLGMQYESIRRRLHKNGRNELRLRLIALRVHEWEQQRPHYVYDYHRERCIHGAWSASGACEHGAMGRYAKEAK